MNWITEGSIKLGVDLQRHVEEFAAAFLKYTNLPPDRVEMKIKQTFTRDGLEQTIWFEERKE